MQTPNQATRLFFVLASIVVLVLAVIEVWTDGMLTAGKRGGTEIRQPYLIAMCLIGYGSLALTFVLFAIGVTNRAILTPIAWAGLLLLFSPRIVQAFL